jgi:nitroreductase
MTAGFDPAHTDRLLTTTRSVRRRLDLTRPVEREVVLECLRIAVQAPSRGNSQPWRWLVVDDPAVRAPGRPLPPQPRPVPGGGPAGGRSGVDGDLRLLTVPVRPPARGAGAGGPVRAATSAGGRLGVRPRGAVWVDRAGGVELHAGAAQPGLGSAYTTLHLNYEREAAEVLGIPDTVTQVTMIPVAWYTGDDFRPARRGPVKQVVYLNRWRHKPGP